MCKCYMQHTEKNKLWTTSSCLSFFIILFFYSQLCCIFVAGWAFLCLQQAEATLVAVRRLSLVVEHGSQGVWASVAEARRLSGCDSWALGRGLSVAHGLRCSAACGTFPDQGSDLCLLRWQVDASPLSHQESPHLSFTVYTLAFIKLLQVNYIQTVP